MFIILDYFDEDYVQIVCDTDGKTKYFKTLKGVKKYMNSEVQNGQIVEVNKQY